MRQIVEFMLNRMDTHPDEFLQEKKREVKHNWMGYYKNIKKFLTEEENQAIWSKLSDINLEDTMSHITQKLLEPENEELTPEAFGAALGNAYWAQSQSKPSKIIASQQQIETIKLQMQKQRDEMKKHMEAHLYSLEGRYESDKDNG